MVLKIILIRLKNFLKIFNKFFFFVLNLEIFLFFFKKIKKILFNIKNNIYVFSYFFVNIFVSFKIYLFNLEAKFWLFKRFTPFINLLNKFFKVQLTNFIILNLIINFLLTWFVFLLVFFFKILIVYFFFFLECVFLFFKIYFSFINNFYDDYIKQPLINSINYTKESLILWFWDIIEAEVERRKVGTVDDFIENSTAVLNFIKNFFVNCYLSVIWFFKEFFKSLVDLKNVKPGLIFIVHVAYLEIVTFYFYFFKIFKLKIKFFYIQKFIENKIFNNKVPVYVVILILLVILLKIFKTIFLYNILSSKVFDMFFIYFKSYKKFFIYLLFKFDSCFEKFKFKRYTILKIFGIKNRFEESFEYSENYFFKKKHWLIRNSFTRWFFHKIRIDRAKYKFAEKIRKRLYVSHKQRRWIYGFFKVVVFNSIFYIFDKLFNFYILFKVIDILKDIA